MCVRTCVCVCVRMCAYVCTLFPHLRQRLFEAATDTNTGVCVRVRAILIIVTVEKGNLKVSE